MESGEITIRVRYAETDRMGFLHHANHLVFFEQGRVELLRQLGIDYKKLEDDGHFLVLRNIADKYKAPAYYDDLLILRTITTRATPVRLDHRYELLRDGQVIAEGETTLVCVDREGKVQQMPECFQAKK
jgi:acyl-CoA thioester hydrolase